MGGPFAPSSRPISIERAVEILRQWPDAHHIDGLVLDEVEAYTQNFYAQFKEASTGKGAVQVLVDRYTGRSMPEMGPNMMWNAKYGKVMMQEMMSGSEMMMGGASTIPPASAIAEAGGMVDAPRSEEHTSELQSHSDLVCRLMREKKKKYAETRCLRMRTGHST